MSSVGLAMSCFPWHFWHSGHLCFSNSFLCLLPSNKVPFIEWQFRHTWATELAASGSAAWLPWQSLHAGAPRSPFSSSALPWTDFLNCSSWLVGSGAPSGSS